MIPAKEDADSGKDSRAADRGRRIADLYPLPEEDTTKDDKPNDGTDSENGPQDKNGNEHENGNQHENGNEHVYNVAAAQQDALDSCLDETRRVKVLRVRFRDAASVFFHEYLTSAGGYACPDQQRILVATIKQLQADLGIDYNYAAMWTIRVFFSLPMFNNNYFGMIEVSPLGR
ncbi:hypothetical protein AAVH_29369 [Aphelenchoides avenae]|nr:hypothetical protein AAVH_29369 [Aphelenchus avenae]